MHTLPHHFERLLSAIQPPDNRLAAARDLPPKVRDYLRGCTEVVTVSPHTRLAGSYARSTAAGDVKDVDILVILDADYQQQQPSIALTALGEALEALPEELGYSDGEVDTQPQRRSHHVYFADEDFHLDVVPAVAPDGVDDVLLVPDREWEKWVRSHPLGYGAHLSDVNSKHEDKVVRLVKLMKHWRDVHMVNRRPKSYWLEVLVVRHICRGWVTTADQSYAEVFAGLLDSIHGRYEAIFEEAGKVPVIPDPMLGNNVAWNWKRSHFETFFRRLDESRGWARRALETNDRDEAVRLWQKVFNGADGDAFPSSVDEEVKRLAGLLRDAPAVTSSGRVVPAVSAGAVAIPSPPHRFYGES